MFVIIKRNGWTAVKDMTNLQKLIDLLSQPDYHVKCQAAKASGSCLNCGQPADSFSNRLSAFEYAVSSLCEKCQNKFIHSDDQLVTSH